MSLIAPVTSVDLLLKIALSYTWVREKGNNRGEAVEHILEAAHLTPGNPWCAAFVSMVGRDAFAEEWPLPPVGGCATLAEAAAAKHMLMKYPTPGSIFLLWDKYGGRFHHTGFVREPAHTGWKTVEGNTNIAGSPEGIGVFVRCRVFTPADRFIWWWRPLPQ